MDKSFNSKFQSDLFELADLTKATFNTPIVLITFLDGNVFRCKVHIGTSLSEFPRADFFCNETISHPQKSLFYKDARVLDKKLFLEGQEIRFYAGCAIALGKGEQIGTLCIMDVNPRIFDEQEQALLWKLAKRIERSDDVFYAFEAQQKFANQLKYLKLSSHELICQHNPEGLYEFVSPSAENLLGYKPSELIGKSPYDFFHPVDAIRIRNTAHAQALNKINAGEVVYRYKKKNGEYTYLSTVTDVVLDANNEVQKIVTRSRDVSEKVLSDEQLSQNIESIKTIYKATANASGQQFLDNCAKALKEVLDADIVFIGEYFDKSKEIKTLTFVDADGVSQNITYNIQGTPCENVKNEGSSFFGKDIKEIFPQDQILIDLNAQGYLGAAICNERGHFTGIISAIFLKPIENTNFKKSLLDLVSRNIEIELFRQQLQEKNIANDNYLRLINENANELISVIRGDRLEFVSASFKKILGFEESEVLGISIKEIIEKIHPDDRKSIYKKIKTAHKKKETKLHYTYRALTKTGFIWLEDSVTLEYDANGNHVASYVISRDVTQHINDLKRIHESESKFKSYFQFNPAATYIWKKLEDDFLLIDINEAANKLSEGQSNLFLNKTASEIYDDRPEIRKLMFKSFNSKKHIEKSFELKSKYLRRTLNLNYKFSCVDLDTLIVVIEDMTFLKKSEAEIRASEEKYRFLVENTSDLVALLNTKGEFMYLSPNIYEFTGFSVEEYLSFNGFNNVHSEDVPALAQLLQEMAKGKSKAIAQYRIKRKDGRFMWIQTRSRAIKGHDGQIAQILTNSSDITEIKKYEEELINAKRRAEKSEENLAIKNIKIANQNLELSNSNLELKKANHELDSFVYRASHDLRSPISSALGLANLMKMTEDVNELKHYGSLQEERLKLLDKFIKDILDYSRNTRQELALAPINLNDLTINILKEVQYVIDQKQIRLLKEVDIQRSIESDEMRLVIILKNLVSNAIKFKRDQQDQSFIKIQIKEEDSTLIILVEDNGIGIKEEYLDKIFNMFYRATDITSGSGLGLYMVKECVERLSGKIFVYSEYGKGTTFKVEIPLRLEKANLV